VIVNALLDDLQWRGLIAQSTDLDNLRSDLDAGPITYYCGFDPTAPSLHLGNLLQIITMRRLQDAGHRPLALVGGATGLIGDPKSSGERSLNAAETVVEWSARVRGQLERYFAFDGPNAVQLVNNYDWIHQVDVISFLRDIGKHFSVNRMLDREAVAARLAAGGISFTEFSYQVLQSYDFLQLFRTYGCRLQTGGSDQWGNITAGVDLIRRTEAQSVHALTTPLVTKADGTKFGKTESGTVWLDPEMTSPYAFYQFWVNSDDRDISNYARLYSLQPAQVLEAWEAATAEAPQRREAQRGLATELTTLVHGSDACRAVEAASAALFGQGDLAEVPSDTLAAALAELPTAIVDAGEIVNGHLPDIVELLTRSGLASGRGAARRTISEGGAYVNNVRVTDEAWSPGISDALGGRFLVLRRGRRTLAGVRIEAPASA
jgi:tyrosyl-tRNA synthetase